MPQDSHKRLQQVAPKPIQLNDGTFGHTHFSEASHVTDVLLGEYHWVTGDAMSGLYVVWAIRVVIDDALHSLIVLYKRYSDIERLRKNLTRDFPEEEIPVLPPKDSLSILKLWSSDLWLEHRRRGLQWFLTNVLLNPKFQHLKVITEFILS